MTKLALNTKMRRKTRQKIRAEEVIRKKERSRRDVSHLERKYQRVTRLLRSRRREAVDVGSGGWRHPLRRPFREIGGSGGGAQHQVRPQGVRRARCRRRPSRHVRYAGQEERRSLLLRRGRLRCRGRHRRGWRRRRWRSGRRKVAGGSRGGGGDGGGRGLLLAGRGQLHDAGHGALGPRSHARMRLSEVAAAGDGEGELLPAEVALEASQRRQRLPTSAAHSTSEALPQSQPSRAAGGLAAGGGGDGNGGSGGGDGVDGASGRHLRQQLRRRGRRGEVERKHGTRWRHRGQVLRQAGGEGGTERRLRPQCSVALDREIQRQLLTGLEGPARAAEDGTARGGGGRGGSSESGGLEFHERAGFAAVHLEEEEQEGAERAGSKQEMKKVPWSLS